MALKIRGMKDLSAGLMFIVVGGMFAIGANQYPMGTAVRMGPAYFPSVLGWILVVLGLIVFVRSFYMDDDEVIRKTNYRPLLLVIGAVFVFAFLLDKAGLVIASFALMFISAMGGWDFKWKEQVVNSVVMSAVITGMFYYGLGLPFKLFPWS
jgi:putative tricarboxylic transport membrane protein